MTLEEDGPSSGDPVGKGQTILVPAACSPIKVAAAAPNTTVLQMHLP